MDSSLIQSLKDPARYPHEVDRVELAETHISWVLLAGQRVYKIKKPVDLGFLDFSSLERRRFFCFEELRLNRRQAPDLYLDVVSITGDPSDPVLDGPGEAIEYAVCMRRFSTSDSFDHLLADGRLERRHIRELAEQLADLHRRAAVAEPSSRFGRPDRVKQPIRETLNTLPRALANRFGQNRLEHLNHWVEQRCSALEPLLQNRRQGFIRECHGDAHMGNVTLFRGRTTLFDCIEFSEDLRWIDTINDLAFSAMDLRARGAENLGWLLIDRYLALTGDFAGLGLLKLYMAYRALVRAKVLALRAGQNEAGEGDNDLDPALRYLALAEHIAGEHQPAIFITMGLSGSGKSTLAERLLASRGLIRLRSDIERKRRYGLAPDQRSHSGLEQDLYSPRATQRTYDRLLALAGQVAAAGLPVLVDATFLKRSEREAFRQLARRLDIPFMVLAMEADEATLRRRISARNEGGADASEADLSVLEHQLKHHQPLACDEREQALRIDTTEALAFEKADARLAAMLEPGRT
ncbi:MAG: AAA family ATPase [Wenzhouxiangellaceae bacterium]|nr:AAA family ATPase [Wenzhouxiangellaceae bacterium]